ncbi:TonB-dependent receptor [Paucibacter sp. R3-3]|uniref:TonB-dependent receptor n=1 Tax=Roseateles agri TaxID=3098619 RepID=A0ABU5DE15_9BURK|nr:TonB-dependent receptor [Paucibacter sp. R3-3]MDY0744523.1 TonB-dependent receptor [Paucibacter sp. R3-3]
MTDPKLSRAKLAASLALALAAWPAAAQDNKSQLDTVTVTAQRRVEDIKDVPAAVTTISGDALDALNASGQDVRMLSGRLPSLNIESSFGRAFPRFYIRGYGNTDFHLNASQPVSLIYDDVVQENPILKGFPVFDVKAVEVIAGPQGTLFGRNTPAGVVKFDSVAPSQKQDGYVSVGIGNLSSYSLEGAANLPLSGDWAARISVQDQHRGNWVTNTFPDAQTPKTEGFTDLALRLQALYKNGDFSALFNIHHRDLDGSPRLFRAGILVPGTNDLNPDFDPKKVSFDGKNEQKVKATGGSVRLKWDLPDVAIYSITGIETVQPFSRGDVDGGANYTFNFATPPAKLLPLNQQLGTAAFPVETSDELHGHRQLSQEVRVESKTPGPLSWQTGVFAFDERYTWQAIDYINCAPLNCQEFTHQTNRAFAVFGSVGYQLTPDFKLSAGARYTRDKKTLNSTAVDATVNSDGTALHPSGASTNDSKWTWDASAVYSLDKSTNVYAKVGTGFRASAVIPAGLKEAFGGTLLTASPETLTSYELGIKSDFWNRRARLSADVFSYDVKNMQLTSVGGNANSNSVQSINKVTGRGIELNLDLLPIDNLMIHLSGSINDTKIKDPNATAGPCGGGCTPLNPTAPSGAYYLNGNPLPNAPKYVGNFNLRYGFPLSDGSEVYVYTDWTYRSSVLLPLYKSVEFTGKPLTEGGLRGGYIWNNGKYEVAAYVRNITNKIVNTGDIDFNNLTGFINDPRTYGVQFKALF